MHHFWCSLAISGFAGGLTSNSLRSWTYIIRAVLGREFYCQRRFKGQSRQEVLISWPFANSPIHAYEASQTLRMSPNLAYGGARGGSNPCGDSRNISRVVHKRNWTFMQFYTGLGWEVGSRLPDFFQASWGSVGVGKQQQERNQPNLGRTPVCPSYKLPHPDIRINGTRVYQ